MPLLLSQTTTSLVLDRVIINLESGDSMMDSTTPLYPPNVRNNLALPGAVTPPGDAALSSHTLMVWSQLEEKRYLPSEEKPIARISSPCAPTSSDCSMSVPVEASQMFQA